MEMTGAELASKQKSSAVFKSLNGITCDELSLPRQDLAWWEDAKIGLFFHWGLYSLLGKGEWVRFNDSMTAESYDDILPSQFNPQGSPMTGLAKAAKTLGANYMVMVSKHHDGFALWDSQTSHKHYTSMNSAAKRDFVKEYVEAARQQDLAVGLYYSPMDWRFPGYFDPKGQHDNALLMKKQTYGQICELMNHYGPIDILWYDGSWLAHQGTDADAAWLWDPITLNKMVRTFQPNILINPRSGWEGDFECDEGNHEITGDIIPIPWEKCMSITGAWSFRPQDSVMPASEVIPMIINVVGRGGNLLINVGPDPNGQLSPSTHETIEQTGQWLAKYGDSIYNTRAGIFQPVDHVYVSTYKEDIVYLHILDPIKFAKETLPSIPYTIQQITTWDSIPCDFTQDESGIRISLTGEETDSFAPLKIHLTKPVEGFA